MGHSIIIVHSSYSFFFFFRPDLDLCGLPAWLLPWQHLEPSSSCWPCVFTEAQACSSLLRGFASPSKVSSHRLTKTPLTAGIVIRVPFTCLVLFPTKSLSCTHTHTHAQACTPAVMFPLHTHVKNVFPSTCQTLETKGGYCVWLDTGSALQQSFYPHPESNTHYSLTCRRTQWHEQETPEIWSQEQNDRREL